jgi:DNA-binding MarR family transcriptional regulator
MVHTVMDPEQHAADRTELESLVSDDLREVTAGSDRIGRFFAEAHGLRANDFQALLHIMVAETAGQPISSGELGRRMGLSGAGITYLIDRLIGSGHVRRASHPDDRRKVILRYADLGRDTAHSFFTPLQEHTHAALADLPDADLAATHRVISGLITAMRRFHAELDEADRQAVSGQ